MRHLRIGGCDSYLIHGHAECILCRTTYEYRSIADAASVVVVVVGRGTEALTVVYSACASWRDHRGAAPASILLVLCTTIYYRGSRRDMYQLYKPRAQH